MLVSEKHTNYIFLAEFQKELIAAERIRRLSPTTPVSPKSSQGRDFLAQSHAKETLAKKKKVGPSPPAPTPQASPVKGDLDKNSATTPPIPLLGELLRADQLEEKLYTHEETPQCKFY